MARGRAEATSPPAEALSERDRRELAALGIGEGEAGRQLALLRSPSRHLHLDRPCRLGDGIRRLEEGRHAELLTLAEEAARQGRMLKLVPASGAASRMFEPHVAFYTENPTIRREELARRAESGETPAADLLRFFTHLPRLALAGEMERVLAGAGRDLAALLAAGEYGTLLGVLLSSEGLGYAELPKALIPFHRQGEETRTPFAEHLAEAMAHVADAAGVCRLHLTVPPEHEAHFRAHLEVARGRFGGGRFEVGFSQQRRSTDTLAVDLDGAPIRTVSGDLLLRPGGHGALIENLGELGGDLVFIKNVDNVLPEGRRDAMVRWKKLLAGHLIALQRRCFELVAALAAPGSGDDALEDAAVFLRDELSLCPPATADRRRRRRDLVDRLDRPLRVCGVVLNRGEPGGGPFWARSARGGTSGEVTPQIVEKVQIDVADAGQREILAASTHFNPVDLVCGLRDRHGRAYDLTRFVDAEAVFVSRKAFDGRDVLALERPGLWNGAMAGWNTVFVEVPDDTFAPVKTVLDLLRPEHLPA